MASASPGEPGPIELSSELRAELLDPAGWREVLATFARTMRVAVALTDSEGRLLGSCYNPQPVWTLARGDRPESDAACSFCLAPAVPCHAVAEALQTGEMVMVRDQAGLAHIAVPLALGDQRLGALIAGQVFDRYPEQLSLQRLARESAISVQQLWEEAIRQTPISRSTLQVYGDLLGALGRAFLRERYGAIVERKLAETSRRFRLFIESVKDYAIFTVNPAGCVTSWNRGAQRLLGYTEKEILGQNSSRMFTPEDIESGAPGADLRQARRAGSVDVERWQVRKDGTRFLANSTLAASGFGNLLEFGRIMRDVTERRNSERAVFEAQRLESIGVLAGGVAHDFNNVLAGIVVNASSLLEDSSQLPANKPLLEDILAAAEMAANLVKQLLAYAGKGSFATSRFDLSHLVSEMRSVILPSIPKNVDLQLAVAPELPWIEADASQIQQIVMNLVINGAEASDSAGGVVRVSTGVATPGSCQDGEPGPCVYLEVCDSGHGMDAAICSRIFDPFFTTKFLGRGLGLAMVSGIVRRHEGRMQVKSVPGQGSTFRVFLPAIPHGGDQPSRSE
jgi:PAS domain S-box-containing protein